VRVTQIFNLSISQSGLHFLFTGSRAIVCSAAASTFLSGCALLSAAPSASEPPIAYVWPLDRCLSDPAPQTYAQANGGDRLLAVGGLGGALASVALGEAASTLFGIPSQVLSQAAKADAAGYSVTSTNARFYYTDVTDTTDPKYGASLRRLAPPACYVIAVYRSPDVARVKAASWCEAGSAFSSAAPETCKNGKDQLDALTLASPIGGRTAMTTKDILPPDLYVEVGFDELAEVYGKSNGAKAAQAGASQASQAPASKASIVWPKAKVLYYPASLQTKGSDRKRQLTIGVVLSQVTTYASSSQGTARVTANSAEEAGLLNVNFTLTLNAEAPGPNASDPKIAAYPQGWAFIPGLHDTIDVAVPTGGSPALSPGEDALNRVPVNVVASVHEVGDPSVFLAALAGATQSAGSDYSKAVVSAVLPPPGTLNASQTDSKNQAAVSALAGSYSKDLASFWKECSKPTNAGAGESSYLDSLWQIVYQDAQQANQTASAYGTTSNIGSVSATRQTRCGGL